MTKPPQDSAHVVVLQLNRTRSSESSSKNAALYPLLMLTLAAVAQIFARETLNPLQEAVRSTLDLSDNEISLLQGAALALPFVALSVPLGALIDRHSRARILVALTFLEAFGNICAAISHSFASLLIARCIVGIATLAISPVCQSLIADLFLPQQRGRAMMVTSVGQVLGASLVFALGGHLLLALDAHGGSWRGAMIWLSAPIVLVGAALLSLREPARRDLAPRQTYLRKSMRELWHLRLLFVPVAVGIVLAEIESGAIIIWAAPAFSRIFKLGSDSVGTTMAVVLLVSGLVGPVVGGYFADVAQRVGGPRRTLLFLCCLSLIGVPMGAFGLVGSAISAEIMLIILMTLICAVCVMGTALLIVVIPSHLRGLGMSMFAGASVLFGIGVSPLAVSILTGVFGGASQIGLALACVCAISGGAGAGIFLYGRKHYEENQSGLLMDGA